ncbi:hypothetical protein BDN72DRAFT_772541 [Pluteus cervinus]|uniref:Uncharacterized protein n=1 Tax=Pluteus cervinus TaxID=181527 RepID=A0ACD3ALC8_9AGAR|nr:hypothetical protein BDN72DRAFT_772541 [Pluteus cervinus]
MATRFKLVFFSPKESTTSILSHLFAKHPQTVGRIGNYQSCAFVTPGVGQFLASDGAKPAIGAVGELERVDEDKVEVVVRDEGESREITEAITALKEVRPYEEVAYEVYRMEPF